MTWPPFEPTMPQLVERSLEIAREVARRNPDSPVFVSGSPLAGLGTVTSDVDVFVVDLHAEKGVPFPEITLSDGTQVDVERHSLAALSDRLDKLVPFALTSKNLDQLSHTFRWNVDPLIRLALGTIVQDDGSLETLRSRIAEGRQDLERVLVARLSTEMRSWVEDVEGLLAGGQPSAALHLARYALLSAAEAFLVTRGDVYLGHKWVWHKWARSGEGALKEVDQVLDFAATTEAATDPVTALLVAQTLVLSAGTGEVCVQGGDPGGWQRDPFAVPLFVSDGMLVYRSSGRVARISHQGALLWALSHGRSREEAIDQTGRRLASRGAEVPAKAIGDYFDTLAGGGLISRG